MSTGSVQSPTGEVRRELGWAIALGILLVVLGIVAVARPFLVGIAATLVFGLVMLLSGVSEIVYAVQTRGAGKFALKLLVGAVYLVAGGLLLFYPLGGLMTLTLILGVAIVARGVFRVVLSLQARPAAGWGWLLFSGLLGIVVGVLIWMQWPLDALWLVGLLLGVNLIVDGAAVAISSGVLRSRLAQPSAG
jgi:uncharacterized membrane protein HdeD (DUF308 family)